MLKLLVAIDGSEHARHALDAAARLARDATVDVVLVNVLATPGYYGEMVPFDFQTLEGSFREGQASLLHAALTQARALGLQTVRSVAVEGPPAQEIARLAADEAVDQIVMGTRGMNALGGLLLGSVAQRVVHLATMPVLLVK
jgi:nucleotide-binding universal stress UspA family protein